ncbi:MULTISPECIES: RNA chaperone Hfq [Commensalibacter]|uniref:RNA-binding protein Hfq n=2 Tax=Commensalibacter TaxID=1079922 RepID=W7DX19_9PROT|nr:MULTISPECIES: RNA chaperone Hfq [Commensalibacter]EUK18738.1 RNA-binding protein Hfq [Commensalibacter papalotli (ex Servin-Garciduenas et al. 2014)]CAI3923665.1 sRNA-binding regulator protein Hfq (Hfq) (PDB:1HK9) [Commensalibacter papalotli (ex Botero et al. 2024)]CAI3928454.1 sRNA-binding regulator protein Hfq (Hfq) (PDB:1HK9) [Commensalibacter papalotli (ex Botero et al. 2024)]
MSKDTYQNIQDVFLNQLRKSKVSVTVFLVNGVKLQGIVSGFDNFSILLRRDSHSQLVYKHAVSTIMPATPVQLPFNTPEEQLKDN